MFDLLIPRTSTALVMKNVLLASLSTMLTLGVSWVQAQTFSCDSLQTPQFSVRRAEHCSDQDTLKLVNTTAGSYADSAEYLWLVNDTLVARQQGIDSVSVILPDTGDYKLALIPVAFNACADTALQTITLAPQPQAQIGLQGGGPFCESSAVHFFDSSQGVWSRTQYSWDFDNGASSNQPNPSYRYGSAGNYQVQLTIDNGPSCKDSVNRNIQVSSVDGELRFYDDQGQASVNPVWSNCVQVVGGSAQVTINFSSPDTLFNFTIDFGDGQDTSGTRLLPNTIVSHTYTAFGNFFFTATSQRGACVSMVRGLVVNDRVPSASITPPPSGVQNGCAPQTIYFVNNSQNVGANTRFLWNFGDGSQSAQPAGSAGDTIFHTYTRTNCQKQVSLQAFNRCGVSTASFGFINVYDKDEPGIGINKQQLCWPDDSNITFTNATQPNCFPNNSQRKFYWRFGDGSRTDTVPGFNPVSHTFPGPGDYEVTLIAENPCGIDSIRRIITITESAATDFTAQFTGTGGCAPLRVQFNNQSTGDNLRYRWDFGDGSQSNERAPDHLYLDAGVYDVRLRANNACNADVHRDSLVIYAKPDAQFSGANSGCAPHEIRLQNQTDDLSPHAVQRWDFGDGNTYRGAHPPAHVYKRPGTYTIRLIVEDTCGTDTAETTIKAYEQVAAFTTLDSICRGGAAGFTNESFLLPDSSTNNTYRWDFGDGNTSSQTSPTHVFDTAGQFTVRLIAESPLGCADTASQAFLVKDAVIATASAQDSSLCRGEQVELRYQITSSNAADLDRVVWRFTNGDSSSADTVSRFYYNDGVYPVQLTTFNDIGCTFTDTVPIDVQNYPIPRLSYDTVCQGQPSPMRSISLPNGSNPITITRWDFDTNGAPDASGDTTQTIFSQAGFNRIILEVSNANQCTSRDTFSVFVETPPQVDLTVADSNVCAGSRVRLHPRAQDASGLNWYFPDESDSLINQGVGALNRTYRKVDTLSVQVVGESRNKICQATDSLRLFVRPLPHAHIRLLTDSIGCAPLATTLVLDSTQADSVRWWLGGRRLGVSDTQRAIVMEGRARRRYELVAYSQYGCRPDTARRSVQTTRPRADFDLSTKKGCGPLSVNFFDRSQDAVTYKWRLGQGDTSTMAQPQALYSASTSQDSVYTVRMVVADSNGCQDSLSDSVRVYPPARASFRLSENKGCSPFQPVIDNRSTPGDSGSIADMSFQWQINGAAVSNDKEPQLSFQAHKKDSTYRLRLIAFSEHGCRDTLLGQPQALARPQASFLLSDRAACTPAQIQLSNQTNAPNRLAPSTLNYIWTVNGKALSNRRDVLRTFRAGAQNQDSVYRVELVALSPDGCADSAQNQFVIHPEPEVSFAPEDTALCGPATIQFRNESNPNDSSVNRNQMQFQWNFGNGFSSRNVNASSSYLPAIDRDSTYEVRLIGLSEHGCADTTRNRITLYGKPSAAMQLSQNAACPDVPTTLKAQAPLGAQFQWYTGTGDTLQGDSVGYAFGNQGLRDTVTLISLQVTSARGCAGDLVQKPFVVHTRPIARFNPIPSKACAPAPSFFVNNSLLASQFHWDFGDGDSAQVRNPRHTFSGNGFRDTSYRVRLLAITRNGCVDSISDSIQVLPKPRSAFSLKLSGNCTSDSVYTQNQSQGAQSYRWELGDGRSRSATAPVFQYRDSNQYQIQLIAISDDGCRDTSARLVRVDDPEPVQIQPVDQILCPGAPVQLKSTLKARQRADLNVLRWTLNNKTLSRSDSFQFDTTRPGRYVLTAYRATGAGCTSQDSVVLEVVTRPQPAIQYDTACLGQITTLRHTGSFGGKSGNGVIEWDVDLDDTSDASQKQLRYTFPDTGINRIGLRVVNQEGCVSADTFPIYVQPAPVAHIRLNDSIVCAGDSLLVRNRSQFVDRFRWYRADTPQQSRSRADTSPVVFAFPQSGNLQIVLEGRTRNGCLSRDTATITVKGLPRAKIEADDQTEGCAPFQSLLISQARYADRLKWTSAGKQLGVADSLQGRVNLPNDSVRIALVAMSQYGCRPDTAYEILRTTKPRAAFQVNQSSGCGPLTVRFQDQSTGSSQRTWLFGDGRRASRANSQNQYPAAQTQDSIFTARLVVSDTNQCRDTARQTIRVYPKPTAAFVLDRNSGCSPALFQMTNRSTPGDTGSIRDMRFRWNIDANQFLSTGQDTSVQLSAPGNLDDIRDIQLIAFSEHGCVDTVSKAITVHPNPQVAFEWVEGSGCTPFHARAINETQPANQLSAAQLRYEWMVNQKDTSRSLNWNDTLHAVRGDSLYDVQLVGVDPNGCSDTTRKSLTVYPRPEAVLAPLDTAACGPLGLSFRNRSISNQAGTSGSGLRYNWNLGTGNTSTRKNPTETYQPQTVEDTTYKVTLMVFSPEGCADTARAQVTAYAKPNSDFTLSANSLCDGDTIRFQDQSTGSVLSRYILSNGDSLTAADTGLVLQNPAFTDSTLFVTQEVFSGRGCPGDPRQRSVVIHPTPIADFTMLPEDSGCSPLNVQFSNNSLLGDQYRWQFESAPSSVEVNPSRTFVNTGASRENRQVSLTAISAHGCRNRLHRFVTLYPKPQAGFSLAEEIGCTPTRARFINQSLGGDRFQWDFGPDGVSTEADPRPVLTAMTDQATESRSIELIAQTDRGCRDTLVKVVRLRRSPKAAFALDQVAGCSPLKVTPDNQSVHGAQYEWDFGRQGVINVEDPGAMTFSNTGTSTESRSLQLVVVAENGCRDSIRQQLQLYPEVVARFSSDSGGCAPQQIRYQNESRNGIRYQWIFQKDLTSFAEHPSFTYTEAGSYPATLIAYGSGGCTDTLRRPHAIEILEAPRPVLSVDDFQKTLPDSSFTFAPAVEDSFRQAWLLTGTGDSIGLRDLQPLEYRYPDTGTYRVVLKASNGACVGATEQTVRLLLPKPIPAFRALDTAACEKLRVRFDNQSRYADAYVWYFGDGESSEAQTPVHTYRQPGVYDVTLVTINGSGSSRTTQAGQVQVHPSPTVDFTLDRKDLYLPDAQTQPNTVASNADRFEWFVNGNPVDTGRFPVLEFEQPGRYRVEVKAYNRYDCPVAESVSQVLQVQQGGRIHVPNAFTPDGDGINDGFRPIIPGVQDEDYHLQIFNRWGQLIWETTRVSESWDGTVDGVQVEPEVYIYKVSFRYQDGSSEQKNGHVTLIR